MQKAAAREDFCSTLRILDFGFGACDLFVICYLSFGALPIKVRTSTLWKFGLTGESSAGLPSPSP
jgi:hypothetical protein